MLEDYKNFEPIIYRQMKNALRGNYSESQLYEIRDAIKDGVLTEDEVGWWDFSEIVSNGDVDRLREAGIRVSM